MGRTQKRENPILKKVTLLRILPLIVLIREVISLIGIGKGSSASQHVRVHRGPKQAVMAQLHLQV